MRMFNFLSDLTEDGFLLTALGSTALIGQGALWVLSQAARGAGETMKIPIGLMGIALEEGLKMARDLKNEVSYQIGRLEDGFRHLEWVDEDRRRARRWSSHQSARG